MLPKVVRIPAVAAWSFTSTGTPCSGPGQLAGGGERAVEGVGFVERSLGHGDHRVQFGTRVVEGGDPVEVGLDHIARRCGAVAIRLLNAVDGGFLNIPVQAHRWSHP